MFLEPVEGPANEVGFVASDGRDNEGSIAAMQERRRNQGGLWRFVIYMSWRLSTRKLHAGDGTVGPSRPWYNAEDMLSPHHPIRSNRHASIRELPNFPRMHACMIPTPYGSQGS